MADIQNSRRISPDRTLARAPNVRFRPIADIRTARLDEGVERYGTSERLFVAALSGLAGYVDAVGLVQSKGFFVSFMSGNSTRLGVGIAGSLADALAASGLVASFIIGVTAGSILGRASEPRRVPFVMACVAGLLALAAVFGTTHYLLASLSLTALAMGAENATLERHGRVRVGLTYMTGSVVKLGQALADKLSGTGEGNWFAPLLLLGSFIMGATIGALAASALGFDALWLGSVGALGFAVLGRSMPGLVDPG
jgi:uncharacterized membrane protein YoaK (UPF0700 family)